MLLLLCVTLLVAGVSSLTVDTQNHWAGGFQMQVDIPVTCELTSWQVHIVFSEDVNTVEVWTADVEKGTSPREFIIGNKNYNGVQHVGDKLTFALMGHGSGDIAPTADVTIEGCGGINQTARTTTSTASHGTTLPGASPLPTTGGGSSTKDYGDALKKSILFYYAQRSGKLPANNPIPWRGDSALEDCVVGGWYDAGDHVKFGLPFGATTHLLLWGLKVFKDGYERSGQLDNMYDTVKWALDYMLNAWNPVTKELVAQIGDGHTDHNYWGRPEDMNMTRPCMKVTAGDGGEDIAGEWAAAMAVGYLVFKVKGDAAYATQLLTAAESLYAFSKTLKGSFSGAGPYYGSSGFKDELCEGAMWLYRVTNNVQYLEDAKSNFQDLWAWALSWDDKKIACQLLLYESTGEEVYKKTVLGFMQGWYPDPELQVQYTPCGLAWRDTWGANRYAANSAFLALVAAEVGIHTADYRRWAVEQINYLLGDNNHDGGCYSFEIGYGDKYPLNPHHRAASCPDKPAPCGWDALSAAGPSPHTLYGALVGGPDWSGNYEDSRKDYVMNEVAIDYNSGFQSALAGIEHLIANGNLPVTNNKCPCNK